jgi:hypothetical protein
VFQNICFYVAVEVALLFFGFLKIKTPKSGDFGERERRRKKGNDFTECGVYPKIFDAYFTKKICENPPLRNFEQFLETWETSGFTKHFKNSDSTNKTQNAAQ